MFRRLLLATAASLIAASSAQAKWYEASSKHFVVYSDDSLERVKDYTERLERFDKAIRVWHGAKEDVRGDSARVTVFLVDDTDDIEKIFGAVGSGVAGFYQPIAGQSVAFAPKVGSGDLSSRAILFHEYTHHWMLTNWADAALPPWFVEGFAELHATAIFRDKAVIFGAVPTYRRYTIGAMNLLPMDRLLQFDPGTLSGAERDALYSHGWALTHYLTFDPGRRKMLASYIGALNSGQQPNPGMLTGDSGNLDFKLNSYVRRPSLPSAAFPFDQLPIGEVKLRPLTAGEVAIMPALMASRRAVGRKTAPRVAQVARTVAASYPNDPAVQNELAEAEYDACSVVGTSDAACFARSEAAADRVLAVEPKSLHALLYKGMAQTAALQKAKATDPARWAAARKSLLAANRLDPEAPQPLMAYYDSFEEAGRPATKNAEEGLLYAYALAPYDASLRRKATKILLGRGNLSQARIALAPAVYSSEGGPQKDWLNIMSIMDKGDAKAALAAIVELENKAKADARKGNGKKA